MRRNSHGWRKGPEMTQSIDDIVAFALGNVQEVNK